MKFCPNDGSLLIPKKEGNKVYLVCPKCGYKVEAKEYKVTETIKKKKEVGKGVAGEIETLPRAKGVKCPKCGSDQVVYWTMQTRASDEAETIFYRCLKCGYTWREYE